MGTIKTEFENIQNIKLYWNDKIISISKTLHIRDDKEKWFKLNIEWTTNNWNTKTTLLLQDLEVYWILDFLYNKKEWIKFWRKSNTTKECKSVSFINNKETWDILVKIDTSIKEKWNCVIKLDLLNKMILIKLLEDLIIEETKRFNNIIIDNNYIKEFIKENNLKNNYNTEEENNKEIIKENSNKKK